MIVSNFTVGVEWAQPRPRVSTYGLQISNLEDIDLTFMIEIVVTSPEEAGRRSPAYFDEHIESSGSWSMPFRRDAGAFRAARGIDIGAKQSALFTLGYRPEMDELVHGYIGVRLPPTRTPNFALGTQLAHSARVVFHANRVYQRESGAVGVTDSEGRVQYHVPFAGDFGAEAVALACGPAEQEITAEDYALPSISDLVDDLRKGIDVTSVQGARNLPEHERGAALLDLLGALEVRRDLKPLNDALGELGARVRIVSHGSS